MNVKSIYFCLLFFFLFNYKLTAATLTVNPGDSIQLKVNMLTGGDTLLINPGVYNQKVLVENLNGSVGDSTTILANGAVVLDGSGKTPISREGLITIRNSSFLVVQGFEIQNFTTFGGGPTPLGILIEESGQGIALLNNRIHDISNTSTCTDPCAEGAHGLGVFGTTVSGITDLLIQGNEIYNNTLQSSEAFVINGNVNGFQILDNHVHDNNNIAYDFIGFEGECGACAENEDRARNGIVRGNMARNNSSFTNPWYNGDRSAAGFYVDGGRLMVFDGNYSSGNDFGFEFASEMPGKKTDSIVMMNNMIYDNQIAGLIMGGYDANAGNPGGGSSEAIYIYNNTFFNQIDETEIEFQHRVINCRLANNIIYTAGSVQFAFANFGTGSMGNIWGINHWWGADTSNHVGNLPGNTLVVDPLLADTMSRDLILTAPSPGIDQGVIQANITTWTHPIWGGVVNVHGSEDIGGSIRIENSLIDLGADEFNAANTGPSFYVSTSGDDNNDGSLASPFLTVQKGLDTAMPGDTVFVRDGIYNEKLSWTNSGAPGQLITLCNFGGETPIIEGTGLAGTDLLTIQNKSHIDIKGITFQKNFIQGANGILLVGEGENITIRHCLFDSIGWSSVPCPYNGIGQAHAISVIGNTLNGIHDLYITDNHLQNIITGNSEALTLNGNVYDFEVARDTIHDTYNIGIDIAGHFIDIPGAPDSIEQSRHGIVKECVVYSNRRCDNTDAPAGIYTDGARDVVIQGNLSYDNGNGISVGCENHGKTSSNIAVINNLIYDNDITGIIFGSNVGLLENSLVQNNTIIKNGKVAATPPAGRTEIGLQNSSNSSILQNIIIPRRDADFGVSIFGFTVTNLVVDNNLAYRYSGNATNLYVTGGQYTPMNSLNMNPLFVDHILPDPDLNLQLTSPVIDQGFEQYGQVSEVDYNLSERLVNGALDHGAIESPSGNCPALLVIDNTHFLGGKFTASSQVQFSVMGASSIAPINVYAEEVQVEDMEVEHELVVEQVGCVN